MNDTKTSAAGLEFISKWEGCVLKPYKDIAGLRTIGIGHLILPGENFPDGVEITKAQALDLLSKDLVKCEAAIRKLIKVPLNQNQFDALVSFGFNCGTGVYATSSACKALNEGRHDKVPELLLLWSKANVGGVMQTVKGLYNRRKSEGELFSKAVDTTSSESSQVSVLSDEEKSQVQGWVAVSLREMTDDLMDTAASTRHSEESYRNS